MITIWGRKEALNVKKVLWCLEELSVPYENRAIGGALGGLDTPEFKKLNPNSTIPVLQEGDLVLWESNAILRYLATAYDPEKTLFSADPKVRAQADQWMDWSGCNLFPVIKQMVTQIVRVPQDQRDPSKSVSIYQAIEAQLAIADHALATQPWFSGETFGLADISIAPVYYPWLLFAESRPTYPHLDRWYQQLLQREAFKKCVEIPMK